MDQRLPKHEKIRFRRAEISALSAFPSAAGHGHLMRPSRLGRRLLGTLAAVVTGLTSIAVIGAAVAYLVLANGIGMERIGDEAEAAILDLSGLDVDAKLGPARVSIDRSQFLAVRVPDVSLRSKTDGAPLLDASAIDFGVHALPLLGGSIRLGSARISDARLFAAAFATGGSSDPLAALRNPDGLIDPDLVAPALFDGVRRIFEALDDGSTHSIELDRVEIVLGGGAALSSIRIDSASLARGDKDDVQLSADLEIDGRAITIDGSATLDRKSKRISALSLQVDGDEPSDTGAAVETVSQVIGTARDGGGDAAPVRNRLGRVQLGVAGEEGAADTPSKLVLSGVIGTSTFVIDKNYHLEGDVKLSASITAGENKVRIERLEINQGRSSYVFYGPLGPRPVADGQPPAYRFELASDRSVSAPAGSTEPAMEFSAMVIGTYDPAANRIELPSIDIRTASGALAGRLAAEFVRGKTPGIDLGVTVPEMSVSDAKQLWPITAAGKARRWAMNNLFGGRVTNGEVRFGVPPGRIGNGVPLSGDEISGHVEVSGARFDITGGIPPMRDAAAAIDFRGNDVDVAFKSGAVFLPDGRNVSATDGTFTIRDAYKKIVVGQLEVNIEGDAASVAELASYEPINGLSRTGMTADAFSGKVSGHVSTQIPLVGGLDMKGLNWRVSLDYADLALSKPVEDQLVSEATGNITLDPDKAVVSARARLNGAPAEIAMVEPLRQGGPLRSRDVSLLLDNQAREAIVPGIGMLVDGPITVSFTSAKDEAREIEADVTNARLDIPWVGWSKGAGVSANVTFKLAKDGETTRLRDFRLSGKSFAISGDVTLAGGGLSRARFGSVRLNRGDDISVSIERDGKGFDIEIDGDALDVRPLIKLLKAESSSDDEGGSRRPISVQAKVAGLTGFHDEILSDVSVSYSSAGTTVGSAKVSGKTSSGAAVSMQDRTEDGTRTLQVQSADAGAVLRFLDIYEHMVGGDIKFALAGRAGGTLSGQLDTTNFEVVNEPKLRSLVSTTPAGGDRSLNQAVRREIDTSRVKFERGFALIDKGKAGIVLNKGVLRGPLIGSTFQGVLRDKDGNMDMTGTFMPAYGLNRIFGEIPLVGILLGNGRDRGLIGVTFRLAGNADNPTLQINPLSAIAPGIFRSIFEFR